MTESISSPLPPDEEDRLESLLNYQILDTPNEEQLDELTALAASIFSVPIVLITIIDRKRQWFKSNYGLTIRETERSISFCQFTIMGNAVFEVEDTLADDRFKNNPLVSGSPYMRYYCGAPLINERGFKIGSLALIDRIPKKLDDAQKKTLILLAQQVVNFFELNQTRKELEKEKQQLEERIRQRTTELEQKVAELKKRDEKLISLNNELNRLIYKASHELLGPLKTLQGITNLALHETNIENVHHYLQLSRATEQKLDDALVHLIKIISIKDPSDFTITDWDAVIDRAIVNAQTREKKAVYVQRTITATREFVSDQVLLEMFMEELLVNSMQYNLHEQVQVSISITDREAGVVVTLGDNGIGIREEEKGNIFEMFYKMPSSKLDFSILPECNQPNS